MEGRSSSNRAQAHGNVAVCLSTICQLSASSAVALSSTLSVVRQTHAKKNGVFSYLLSPGKGIGLLSLLVVVAVSKAVAEGEMAKAAAAGVLVVVVVEVY